MRKEPFAVSLVIHLAAIAALLLLQFVSIAKPASQPTISPRFVVKLAAPPPMSMRPKINAASGQAGGNRSPLPASKGSPPKATVRVFIPPQLASVERPKIAIQMGVEDAPALSRPIGDPFGRSGPPSLGPGLNGIGGPGDFGADPGPGANGGKRGGSAPLPKPSKWPELVAKTEPEYSEPARKQKLQGKVLLALEVGVDGRPHNIRVISGIGQGLDEKAMDAVATWRFRPALSNGRPVAAPITVEVNFRLL